jgi:hypothetical protein
VILSLGRACTVVSLRRACTVVAVGAALTACTPVGHVRDHLVLAVTGCGKTNLDDVDWSTARTLDIRIRQDEFQPMVIGLARDLPYVLHIRNADSSAHGFRAPAFFRQAAVAQVTVDGKSRVPDGGCITGVSVPAKGAAEIRLVALLEGRYAFEDPAWLSLGLGLYDEGAGFGTIVVE